MCHLGDNRRYFQPREARRELLLYLIVQAEPAVKMVDCGDVARRPSPPRALPEVQPAYASVRSDVGR